MTLVAWGNAVPLCRQAAEILGEAGVQGELLDLRRCRRGMRSPS